MSWAKWLIVVGLATVAVLGYMSWLNGRLDERWTAGKAEVQKLWDDETKARQAVAITAGENFRKQELRDAVRSTEVEHEARKNEKVVATAVARAADATRGLSRYIATHNAAARSRGLPTAAACPTEFARQRDSAIFARELLGQCGSRYQQVAAAADGIRLKLDTSLNYLGIVAPAEAAVP